MNRYHKHTTALALLLALCLALGACAPLLPPSATATATHAPPQPRLAGARQGLYAPDIVLEGQPDAYAPLNKALLADFEALRLACQPLLDRGLALQSHYLLQGDTLLLSLRQAGHMLIHLRWQIAYDQQQATLQGGVERTALGDTPYLSALLQLRALGIPVSLHMPRAALDPLDYYALLADSAEALRGVKADTADISAEVSKPALRKLLALGVAGDYTEYFLNYEHYDHIKPDTGMLLEMLFGWYAALQENPCANGARAADEAYLTTQLTIYRDLCPPDLAPALVPSAPQTQTKLTRYGCARILVPAYEALMGAVEPSPYALQISDTEDIHAAKAIELGLLGTYHTFNAFEGDNILSCAQALRACQTLMMSLLLADEGGGAVLDYGRMLQMLARAVGFVQGQLPADASLHTVLNERAYYWYVNQYDTGEHADLNCMPACLEMAMLWRDSTNTVNTARLRREFTIGGSGWFPQTLEDAMFEHDVPYEKSDSYTHVDTAIDQMMQQIDAGRLLIVMFNLTNSGIGHAVVVKGYETGAAGTWFIVNDPAMPYPGPYDTPQGIGARVEAMDLLYAMQRHVDFSYSILPPGGEPQQRAG